MPAPAGCRCFSVGLPFQQNRRGPAASPSAAPRSGGSGSARIYPVPERRRARIVIRTRRRPSARGRRQPSPPRGGSPDHHSVSPHRWAIPQGDGVPQRPCQRPGVDWAPYLPCGVALRTAASLPALRCCVAHSVVDECEGHHDLTGTALDHHHAMARVGPPVQDVDVRSRALWGTNGMRGGR